LAIQRSGELPPLVSDVAPDYKAVITVLRRDKTRELTVTEGEMKSLQIECNADSDEPARLGLTERPQTDKERNEADVVAGLMAEEMREGPAQECGHPVG
jgi:hypothetical protein